MYLRDNPVLQSELIVHLRKGRSLAILAALVVGLSAIVLVAWPEQQTLDEVDPLVGRRLIHWLFLGQFVAICFFVPGMAAGAIAGERERTTLEMLLASPMPAGAIVLGKLLASLIYALLLIVAMLPIVVLCLPLGGVSVYEVLVFYWLLLWAAVALASIALAASGRFDRTISALAVAYVVALPGELLLVWFWWQFGGSSAGLRLTLAVSVLPAACLVLSLVLLRLTSRRLAKPGEWGSEGREVFDAHREAKEAMLLVIDREAFPDRLLAPPERGDLLPDGANPVYDKQLRSELFAQGTLMLRLVIQVSLLVAFPLMACFLIFRPDRAAWYASYVLLFEMLVGPIFLAGAICGERERQTLDLLLAAPLGAGRIVAGKLLAGLRVCLTLTGLLVWPIVLVCFLVPYYWAHLATVAAMLGVLALACLTIGLVALACSATCERTGTSMIVSYLLLGALFIGPPAASLLMKLLGAEPATLSSWTLISPFSTLFSLPATLDESGVPTAAGGWMICAGHLLCYALFDLLLVWGIVLRVDARRIG